VCSSSPRTPTTLCCPCPSHNVARSAPAAAPTKPAVYAPHPAPSHLSPRTTRAACATDTASSVARLKTIKATSNCVHLALRYAHSVWARAQRHVYVETDCVRPAHRADFSQITLIILHQSSHLWGDVGHTKKRWNKERLKRTLHTASHPHTCYAAICTVSRAFRCGVRAWRHPFSKHPFSKQSGELRIGGAELCVQRLANRGGGIRGRSGAKRRADFRSLGYSAVQTQHARPQQCRQAETPHAPPTHARRIPQVRRLGTETPRERHTGEDNGGPGGRCSGRTLWLIDWVRRGTQHGRCPGRQATGRQVLD
jgi:hypothetical protein